MTCAWGATAGRLPAAVVRGDHQRRGQPGGEHRIPNCRWAAATTTCSSWAVDLAAQRPAAGGRQRTTAPPVTCRATTASIELRNGAPRSAEWYYGPQEWLMTSLQLTMKRNAGRGPRWFAGLPDYTESRNDRGFGAAACATRPSTSPASGANLDLEEDLSARTQLLYGAEVRSNDVGSEGVRVDQESGAAGGPQPALSGRFHLEHHVWPMPA